MRSEALMSERSATLARGAILTLSIGSLVAVFQPISHLLFQVGCVTIFLSAILFNLMPFLIAGRSWRSVRTAGSVILAVLILLIVFAVISAWGYVLYLQAR
ncbi:hypothetical protein [Roseibium sp. SCP14]|uniref:hypothetical protein n=1 Tax=Roseibium sp. SCP14 TaxID=3141375 RepID=UPI003337D206